MVWRIARDASHDLQIMCNLKEIAHRADRIAIVQAESHERGRQAAHREIAGQPYVCVCYMCTCVLHSWDTRACARRTSAQ